MPSNTSNYRSLGCYYKGGENVDNYLAPSAADREASGTSLFTKLRAVHRDCVIPHGVTVSLTILFLSYWSLTEINPCSPASGNMALCVHIPQGLTAVYVVFSTNLHSGLREFFFLAVRLPHLG